MSDSSPNPIPRQGNTTEQTFTISDSTLHYTASAEWQTLFEQEKPVAEMFHVAYLAETNQGSNRPITFIFNGGPGAASAYLHLGALSPKRIQFGDQGELPKPPVKIVDNLESWLSFTDLVFIDPIGTGFSRALPQPKPDAKSDEKATDKPDGIEFWQVDRDLNALGEFINRFLSRRKRWLSPVFIAGESYGGFRVAKLARKLQQEFGVGLSGAILISPALEFSLLGGDDYTLTTWATLFPSLAASAVQHDRAKWIGKPGDWGTQLSAAEAFARKTFLPFLAMGGAVSAQERQAVYEQIAEFVGLPLSIVERQAGRIDIEVFSRELLRDRARIVGLYDASIVGIDPFPDRVNYEGIDPTLDGLDRLFTAAINSHLRDTLGVETDLTYHLLNLETFKAWKYDIKGDFKQGFVGAVDDLRIGMTLNPSMQVYITHGYFDLVTPYFASNYLADSMRLDPEIRSNLTLRHYPGGHMFYTWAASRQAWFDEMKSFYQTAIA